MVIIEYSPFDKANLVVADCRSAASRKIKSIRTEGNEAIQIGHFLRCLLFHFCRPRYNENVIAVGAQTERRGDAWPVRGLLAGKDLTGRFCFVRPAFKPDILKLHFKFVRLERLSYFPSTPINATASARKRWSSSFCG